MAYYSYIYFQPLYQPYEIFLPGVGPIICVFIVNKYRHGAGNRYWYRFNNKAS